MKALVIASALASAMTVGGASTTADAAADKITVVVCSPGSPGTTDDAQPTMDAFSAAVGAKANVEIAAVYDPSDDGGAKRLANAGIGIVSLPFFFKHESELGLHARLVAVQKGRPALDRWALAVHKGLPATAASLAKFTIVANTAFAPAFVRGLVLAELGAVPTDITLKQSTAVLSGLRAVANGQSTAVVLDGAQEAALAQLPFAKDVAVIAHSQPLPAGLVVTVDKSLPAARWAPIETALLSMTTAQLDSVHIDAFARLDDGVITTARKAYAIGM